MLVLSRRPHEKIILKRGDERIEVCLVRVSVNSARIGVDAGQNWEIMREEIEGRGRESICKPKQ